MVYYGYNYTYVNCWVKLCGPNYTTTPQSQKVEDKAPKSLNHPNLTNMAGQRASHSLIFHSFFFLSSSLSSLSSPRINPPWILKLSSLN